MKTAITIDSAGRVVLPSEARRRLNLRPGSRLLLTVVAERIELTPELDTQTELAAAPSRRKVLPATGKPADAVAATRAEREAQARRRTQR
ncbi:MAG: AbrB/MazE/SpoVT family DNA-binding domain-containing protein [Betaproteobacteria bacterium]|nr:MAG: AbrB/MazE/SpoVT family DNA-binding domain-containing protein [Betaproteobacteria bacterium]